MGLFKSFSPGSGGKNDLLRVKELFFDRKPIETAMDKAVRKGLDKFGAYVRRVAQNSIVPKPGYSRPGHAPHGHTGLLRRYILYYADLSKQSVVIGPAKLGKRYSDTLTMLEYGGRTTRRGKPAVYEARPFMQPAFNRAKSAKKLKDIWSNSVKRGL